MKPTRILKVMQKDPENFSYLKKKFYINKIIKKIGETRINKYSTIGHIYAAPLQLDYLINRLNAWRGPDSWARNEITK